MQASRPRYVLIAEAETVGESHGWRFALMAADASGAVTAGDSEPDADEDRLVLLAAVRGLEALDQPSDVTLVTRSTAVLKGLTRGLDGWRNNHWRWERFGRLTPIRDADLWRRVDQAMRYHNVRCQSWRTEGQGAQRDAEAIAPRSDSAGGCRFESRLVTGRLDSPAMVIVRSARARRRVRIAEPLSAAG